ncbi:helix-turn-helix domain-containing protein [Phaeobacter piscinae]|uniref:helix-turn-helix domain-containing protein n=1 Tax=Phaeobacter piscinae TaxID=1580596 RepID=UPI000BBEAFDC|nr:helix-turn-helix transcriptional regulator [Phaeobacter piscinae]ATG41957.1 transcriptional regulator [Phaeobacter piscinae]
MPHPVDIHVGRRIRNRRWLVGESQQDLASKVGIRFQQIQKYETGANRVSASRLWEIAGALGVDVVHFFEGLADSKDIPADTNITSDVALAKEAVDLVRIYYKIPQKQRVHLSNLAKALAV